MSSYKSTPVTVTTFVNPHLFWLFETENAKKRLAIEKELESGPHAVETDVVVGQIVLVRDNKWKRAIVKSAGQPYSCWLIDYGKLYQTNKVYTLPKEYAEQKALVKQATMNNVVCVKQQFNAVEILATEVIEFTPGIIKRANDYIADATNIFFRCIKEIDGIHLGEITITRPDGLINLAEMMIEEGILAENKDLFQTAFQLNSKVDGPNLLLNREFAGLCKNATLREALHPIQDVVHSKGVGRGTRVSPKQEAPGPKTKKAFLEKWVEESKTTVVENNLSYDSDDSKNDHEITKKAFQYLSKLNVTSRSNDAAKIMDADVTASDSVSQRSESSQKSVEKSKQALIRLVEKNLKGDGGSLTVDVKKIKSNNTTSSSTASVEVEYSGKFVRPEDCCGETERGAVSGDCTFSPKINSSPLTGGLQSDVLRSISKGRGRRISNNNSEDFGKSFATEDSGAEIGTNVGKEQESSSASGLGPITKRSSLESAMEKSNSTRNTLTNVDFKLQHASKLIKWDDFAEDKPAEAQQREHLNIPPSGMAMKPASKRKTKSDEIGEASQDSNSEKLEGGSVVSAVSSKNVATSEMGNSETPKRPCIVGCTCIECKKWNSNTLFEGQSDFVGEAVTKERKPCVKPPLLFKTENDKDDDEIKKHTYIAPGTTTIERATAPKLLVHGTSFAAPVTSVTDPPFHADIHRALRSFEQVYNIQSFVWPSLMRRMNVCMVSAHKSGKTMAYMPAICSYILERKERYKDLPENTISPVAVILCPGAAVAEETFTIVLKLLNRSFNKPAVALAIQPLDRKCLNQFQKQCDVLVATPVTLVSLLQARIITIKRLCHLVIEHADKILNKFPNEIGSILKLVQSMLSHRPCYYTVQLVVTAEQWTLPLENLMKCLNYVPVICIGSYLEAAMYGRAEILVHFLEAQLKMSTLANLLKDKANVCKTVVICTTDEEIKEVKDYLHMNGVGTIIIYDTMAKGEITEMELRWLNTIGGKHLALLCTDQVYNHSLNVTNAVVLVHYTLPSTWSQFINRFGCMLDNYMSPLSSKDPVDHWTRCLVHVFVDEACTKQFPKVMELMQRMRTNVAPAFLSFYKNTINNIEQNNVLTKKGLCPNLKLFGKCKVIKCRMRHMLSPELDYSSNLPKSGVVKFRVVNVQNVTSFTVNLLQYTDEHGKTHQWETHDSLQEDLQKAMTKQRTCVFDVKCNEWYIYHSLEDRTYSRCVVQKILKEEKITKMASEVAILLVDSGIHMNVTASFLYELPKDFQNIRALGVNVYLANMVPPDLDENWSSNSKSNVKAILNHSGCFSDGTYGIGQVLLQLGNVIWVKNILFLEDLSATDVTVTKLNLRKTLQDQHLVDFYDNQLQGLYQLCKEAGIELPDYNLPTKVSKLSNESQAQVQAQWAFFENADCNEVYISSVESPSLFYVRLKKFYDLFENLQKEIQEAIAKPFYPSDFEVQADRCYLAKDPEGDDYCRVKIVEIRENIVEVFYVDFGDTACVNKSDLKYLSDELILKLPFQVIECRLYGVDPVWDDWEKAATDILCEYIFEPNTDYFRTLYTTTCKQEPASMTGGQKCAILLVDNFKERVILINQLLIDCGQAVTLKEEDLDVQFSVPEKYVEEEEPDIDIDCDKEYTLEDLKILQNKYSQQKRENKDTSKVGKKDPELTRPASPDSNDSHHSWDIQINNAEAFMKQLLGINDETYLPPPYQGLPPMRALPPAKHCTPNVIWHQTETHLKLNIILPNLNHYEIRVIRKKVLWFRAEYDDKQYKLDLQLFDEVDKTFQDSPSGPHVKVTLTKCTPTEWPRLILSTQRMRHIRFDISQCNIPEDEKRTFLKLGDDLDDDKKEGNIDTFEFGSDEDYSESDPESNSTD